MKNMEFKRFETGLGKEGADNEVYEKADLIVQTTNRCSKRCKACYLAENSETEKEELSQEIYEDCISKLQEGDLVALRGGEITTIKDWFEKFVAPALNKGLKVMLETNGYFIGTKEYENILKNLCDDRISVRISFDKEHLNEKDSLSEFEKMAKFANDAKNNGIKFGFYALGMDRNQIQDFVKETPLESYSNEFHSLTFYPKISELAIKGKYLKSDGQLSDRIEV